MKLKCVAIGTSIQGVFLISTTLIGLPASLRMAGILYAEDFDAAGSIPGWFAPWYVAMWHPYITHFMFLLVGAALVVTGVSHAKNPMLQVCWLMRTCWVAAISCFGLATAMVPLTMMGGDWAFGTPAHEVRAEVIISTLVVYLEAVLLLATILSLRNVHMSSSHAENTNL